jgi:hypothetical protein
MNSGISNMNYSFTALGATVKLTTLLSLPLSLFPLEYSQNRNKILK